jgi:surface carbohydrate biosynthesis protein
MKILILYERKNREFENCLLLSIILSANGHECKISHFLDATKFEYLTRKFYDCLIVPHLYNSESVFRNIVRFGKFNNIINLQYEQVLSEKWEKLGHHNPKGLAEQGYHVCWGDITRERLIEAGLSEHNCITTGAIQNDMLRPEYRSDHLEIKQAMGLKYNMDPNQHWTLFLSSFTYADISEQRLKLNEDVAGISLLDIVPYYTKSRNKLLEWFDELLSKDFEGLFIYRPHPDELNLDSVYKLAKKYKNFIILGEGAAKGWIESSDKMYTWYSTTVVEAQLLGKSCAILRPIELPGDFDSVLLKKGDFITSVGQFIDVHKSNIFIKAIPDEFISSYYKNFDQPAFKNIVNLLSTLSKRDEFSNVKVPNIHYIKNQFKKLMILIIFKLRKYDKLFVSGRDLGSNNNFLARWILEMNNQMLTPKEAIDMENYLLVKMNNKY